MWLSDTERDGSGNNGNGKSLTTKITNYADVFFSVVLPRLCAGCETKLTPDEKFLCAGCFDTIKMAGDNFLRDEYNKKFSETTIINDFFAPYLYEKEKPLQKLIHTLKYSGNFRAGLFLGKICGMLSEQKIEEWQPDFITIIPLHSYKLRERGYNQTRFIAKGIEQTTGIPYVNLLKRTKYTQTQTGLHLTERKENLNNAFECKTSVEGKRIILIDDIITTGATMLEAGKVIKKAGAEKVFSLAPAITA